MAHLCNVGGMTTSRTFSSMLHSGSLALILGTMGAAVPACDDDTGGQDPELPADDADGQGKADSFQQWHRFDGAGQDALSGTWTTAGGESLELTFDVFESNLAAGDLWLDFACGPQSETGQQAVLRALLDRIGWGRLLSCNEIERTGIRVFPADAEPTLPTYSNLVNECEAMGGTTDSVRYFESHFRGFESDAIVPGGPDDTQNPYVSKEAVGCFRVETSLAGAPQLWMRAVDASEPQSEPSDWVVLSGAAPTQCDICTSSGGGGACASRCETECVSCLESDGGAGCFDRCDNEFLPEGCAKCVENGQGELCVPSCVL